MSQILKLAAATALAVSLSAPVFAQTSISTSFLTPSLQFPSESATFGGDNALPRARPVDNSPCTQLERSAQIPIEECGVKARAEQTKLKQASND